MKHSNFNLPKLLMHKTKLFFTLFFLITIQAFAQNLSNSPYGRYGLGDLSFSPFPHMSGMGMPAIAYADSHTVNLMNPASLTAQRFTVFEMGMMAAQTFYRTQNERTMGRTGGFGYFTLAFGVVPKKWSMAFGLRPLSLIGYELNTSNNLPDIGNVNYRYIGTGGFNVVHLSNGFKLAKNLYAGVNVNYNFGVNEYQRIVLLNDSVNGLNSRNNESNAIFDFNFDFGLRYEKHFKNTYKRVYDKVPVVPGDTLYPGRKVYQYKEAQSDSFYVKIPKRVKRTDSLVVSAGFVFTPSMAANASRTFLSDRFLGQPPNENVLDTIFYIERERGTIVLPQVFSGGIVIKKSSDKFTFAFNGSYYDWSRYRNFENKDSLKNNLRLNFGLQIIPNQYSTKSFASRVRYRAGLTYSDGYLRLNGQNVNEYMISAGVGLPFRRLRFSAATKMPISILNLGIQAGFRGDTKNNLFRENFLRFTIGVSMSDDWFNKRKYD